MYIQPVGRGTPELPFSVPRDYSGNAFAPAPPPPPSPPPADIAVPPPPPLAFDGGEDEAAPAAPDISEADGTSDPPADAAVFAEEESAPPAVPAGGGGLFSRIPLLSSLMPPPRGRGKDKGGLPDWVLIAALIFLFSGEGDEDDILPFLLLLLLWN